MSKMVDIILDEWALFSDNGLLLDICSKKNLDALREALVFNGLSEDDALEVATEVFEQSNFKSIKEVAPTDVETSNVSIYDHLHREKKLKPAYVTALKKIFTENPHLKFFEDQYNSVEVNSIREIERVLSVYNNGMNTQVVEEFNKFSDATLGKGELALVWLIKDAKSGGSQTGDVILRNGEIIDVKGYGKGHVIRVEQNSFDNFQTLPFYSAMVELVSLLNKPPAFDSGYVDPKDVLINILLNDKLGPVDAEVRKHTTAFLRKPGLDSVGVNAFKGLAIIRSRLKDMDISNSTDILTVNSHGKKYSANLDNPQEVIPPIKNISEPDIIDVEMSPIKDVVGGVLIPKLKRLRFFSEEITIERITQEAFSVLHYDGIILVDHLGKNAVFVPRDDFEKTFSFYTFSKGVNFKLK